MVSGEDSCFSWDKNWIKDNLIKLVYIFERNRKIRVWGSFVVYVKRKERAKDFGERAKALGKNTIRACCLCFCYIYKVKRDYSSKS